MRAPKVRGDAHDGPIERHAQAGRGHDSVDEKAWREDEVGEPPVATLHPAVSVVGEHDRAHDDQECCQEPDRHAATVTRDAGFVKKTDEGVTTGT
jgi:hypothetical protein